MSLRNQLIALLVAVGSPLFALAADDGRPRTSRKEVSDALYAYRFSGDEPRRIEQVVRRNGPLFVFVPGVLGSKLTNADNQVIWGKLRWSDYDTHKTDLYYDPDRPATVEFLDSFKVLGFDTDVYGGFSRRIRDLRIGDVEHLVTFPYDWRQDLRESARQLDAAFRSNEWKSLAEGRSVNIIAHSMGGLVVTYWYHKYYAGHKKTYPFEELKEVIFLGTPHRGSAAALQSLIDGYSCNGCGKFEKQIFRNFFASLNDAAYTFPSLFQMLPLDETVIARDEYGREMSRNHFSVETWKHYGWGGKALRNMNRARRGKAEITEEEFYASIDRLLRDGHQFQTEIDKFGPVPNAHYFYTLEFQTPAKLEVERTGLVRARPTEAGDGRVTESVAKNRQRTKGDESAALRYRLAVTEHGALTGDAHFVAMIRDLCDSYEAKGNAALAAEALADREIFNALQQARVLLPVPPTAEVDAEADLVKLNQQLLASYAKDGSRWLYTAARRAHKQDRTNAARRLYSTYLAVAPGEEAYHAAHNLGTLLLEHARVDTATKYLEMAATLEPLKNETKSRAQTLNALGLAYNAQGKCDLAQTSFQGAVKLNHVKAKTNLVSLQTECATPDD